MSAFLSPSALVLAAEWAVRPGDAVIGVGYGIALAGIGAAVLVLVFGPLARDARWDDRQVEAVYAPTLSRVRAVASAAGGAAPGWAERDLNTPPAAVVPQPAYRPDPWLVVERMFASEGLPPRPPVVHAFGRAEAPPVEEPREAFARLGEISEHLHRATDETQALPVVRLR